jgi:hypothetical protein
MMEREQLRNVARRDASVRIRFDWVDPGGRDRRP